MARLVSLALRITPRYCISRHGIKVCGARQARAYKTRYTLIDRRNDADKGREAGLENASKGDGRICDVARCSDVRMTDRPGFKRWRTRYAPYQLDPEGT